MLILITLIYSLVCAVLCHQVAKMKKRNTVKWSVSGFCFGIFALIPLVCTPTSDANTKRPS